MEQGSITLLFKGDCVVSAAMYMSGMSTLQRVSTTVTSFFKRRLSEQDCHKCTHRHLGDTLYIPRHASVYMCMHLQLSCF